MATSNLALFKAKLFINNEYVDAKSPEKISVYNPADETLVTSEFPVAGPEDVDAAVDGARKAFKSGPWKDFTPSQRAACIMKLADLIEENGEELFKLETVAMGAPSYMAPFITKMSTEAWRYYAGWADKIPGQTFRSEGGKPFTFVTYEPIGVCAGIAPWNASLTTFAWKAGPALAAGNTVVFKSSEKAPLGLAAMGDLIKRAGFPPGVVQILSGPGSTGALLAQHMNVSKISFTGSVATGKKVQEMALKSNMKRVTLELGGKSPAIVFNDADIENAVKYCASGLLVNTGQACIASSRTLVQKDIAPKFIEALTTAFSQTQGLGPLADRSQFERVMSFIETGKKEASLATGGARVGDKGYYVAPTLFVDPGLDAKIYKEEIFGPVGTVRTFSTEEEVVELANDTLYGLSATVFTSSISRALRVAGKLESGTVGVNTSFMPSIEVPFGGWKESGLGRELGRDGLSAYLETKTVQINMQV
ncbi:aldehyde dehydrogenase [Paraphoma chrysanthemicola]|uniref:aldehyde dehydrogenase (NAD(+)) n=1 Tax=Paraphoma chrysanthemicola TaxID=798071 RepID=A0A8K0R7D3_9PLEO|nr:aldehyde dehydrogenase [Paraphoma chrysanthemicola]